MNEIIRCGWCNSSKLYQDYHDNEWANPVYDDKILFEFLLLEGFQAGLSWITILNKREGFREAFDDFDYKKIATYDQKKLDQLMIDDRIVKNKLKIKASVTNALAFIKIQKEFGSFSEYFWRFTDRNIIDNKPENLKDIPAKTDLSDKISIDLKKKGFKFVGSTIVYAYMQAVGMVNDHVINCSFRNKLNNII